MIIHIQRSFLPGSPETDHTLCRRRGKKEENEHTSTMYGTADLAQPGTKKNRWIIL